MKREVAIEIIQRRYKKKLLLREFKKNEQLFKELHSRHLLKSLNDNQEKNLFNSLSAYEKLGKCFDVFAKFIRSKSVILSIRKFLKIYHRFLNIQTSSPIIMSSQIFLSIYLIHGYPDIILSPKKTPIDNLIYNLSNDLITYIHNIVSNSDSDSDSDSNSSKENFRLFRKHMIMYSNIFQVWKDSDKYRLVEDLILKWYETTKTLKEIKNSIKYSESESKGSVDILQKSADGMVTKIKKIDPKFDTKILDQYHAIHNQLETQYKKAYWDKLSDDIKNENYDFLISNLKDIRNQYCKLISKRHDMHADFNEHFDIELIEQMITNKAYSPSDFYKHCTFLFDKLGALQAPIRKSESKIKWDSTVKDAINDPYHSFVPKMLKLFYEIIEEIKEDKEIILSLAKSGVNVLKL